MPCSPPGHEDGGRPMDDDCRACRDLISGYLDGELTREEQAKVERCLEESEAFRKEFERMKRLVNATSDLAVEMPPEEVWDTFLDGVYNRMERQTGWIIFIIGVIGLAAFGIYVFVMEPWADALIKLLIATPVAGLLVLFISVLRQRLFVAKTDRYSKEIQR